MGRLDGKVALISGTAGGQGRAAALLFAAEGARIVGCDLDAERARETVALVRAVGGEMISIAPLDVSDDEGARTWIDRAVTEWGGIDVLYNNASIARFSPVAETSADDWRFVVRNELDIVFYCARAAWPRLVERGGGSIVNTASVSGLMGNRLLPMSAHAATKAAVIGLTRQLAAEGSTVGIRANTITPGVVETPATAQLQAQGGATPFSAMVERTPLGLGTPEDIAYGALYLASDESRWVTGTNLIIDGGRSSVLT
jgi:NAD(P)-dependent dehydrogenase (short-subunit alcohol dehydrogenase family)